MLFSFGVVLATVNGVVVNVEVDKDVGITVCQKWKSIIKKVRMWNQHGSHANDQYGIHDLLSICLRLPL